MKTIASVASRLGLVTALAIGAAASLGCTQSTAASGPADPSPSAAQQTHADLAVGASHEMHGPPGPEMLLVAALHHLDLTGEQRTTIETAAKSIGPAMPHDPGLFHAVADGVRAGKLDEAALLAKVDSTEPPADHGAALASALDTLHSTLTADQRRALVDMIAKHIDEHDQGQAGAPEGPAGLVGHLLSGLNLTSDQRASVDRILAAEVNPEDQATMAARIHALHAELRDRLQGFSADRFDAAAFLTPWKNAGPANMRGHVERTLHALNAVLPVLDPAQRETLAATIEAGPQHGR